MDVVVLLLVAVVMVCVAVAAAVAVLSPIVTRSQGHGQSFCKLQQ